MSRYFNPSFSKSVDEPQNGVRIAPRDTVSLPYPPPKSLLEKGELIHIQGPAEAPRVVASSQPIQVASAPLIVDNNEEVS